MLFRSLDRYINAATRDNTRKSYQGAVRHFEDEWCGLLPATPDAIARYLVDYADTLSSATLKNRLSGLARWHQDQGFPDPTKTSIVRSVMKGIRREHPYQPKQATPISIESLQKLDDWFDRQISSRGIDSSEYLTWVRNRALVYLGFWRAFRADELSKVDIKNINFSSGGMTAFLPTSKSDRENVGRTVRIPILNALCPVTAVKEWLSTSKLVTGPLFRKIERTGVIGTNALHPNSISPLIKKTFESAEVEGFEQFSSHSLKRGFATWAADNGWDAKMLMDYVGWADAKTALAYVEAKDPFAQLAINNGNNQPGSIITSQQHTAEGKGSTEPVRTLNVYLRLERYNKGVRTKKKALAAIERFCFKSHQMTPIQNRKHQYTIQSPIQDDEKFSEWVAELIDDAHRIATSHQCALELSIQDPDTKEYWD